MSLRVLFFASLAERVGRREATLDHAPGLTPQGVWAAVVGGAVPARVLAARNQAHCTLDAPLDDGDELAFFPPVTGG